MKISTLILGLLLITLFLKAQNLVPNPSFELFYECPTGLAQLKLTKNWFSGNTGTPEYLRMKCPFEQGEPHSGKGYVGAIFFGQYPKAVEYIMVKLKESLQADSTYCLSFWIRAEESFVYIDQIGMHLTAENLKLEMWAPIFVEPTLNSDYNKPIIPQLGWSKIMGEYNAKGGEQYLSLGNFVKPDRHIRFVDEFYGAFEAGWNSYYFVDDVEVKLKTKENGCKEIITEDIIKEEKIVQNNSSNFGKLQNSKTVIYFNSDKKTPNSKELERLYIFMDTIKMVNVEYIELVGHTDTIGTESYNLELSHKRILQIREIIIAKLSVTSSFKLNYFGESKPEVQNGSLKSHAQNRRVEIKVVYYERKRKQKNN